MVVAAAVAIVASVAVVSVEVLIDADAIATLAWVNQITLMA
jgi:hypothetical protein